LTLWFNLGMDQSIFCYSAWVRKTFDQPPYIGSFDHAFPGIFIIHRIALELFGDTILGFRLFDFFLQLSALGLIFYLARRMSGGPRAGFLAAVFYSIYYYGLRSTDTGQREGFIFWLLLIAVSLAVTLDRSIRLRAALIGLLCGFIFLLKPTYGLVWPVFGLYFLARGIRPRPRLVWLELALFSFFCLAPSLIIIFYYWRLDYLNELFQILIWFNSKIYSRMIDPGGESAAWWLNAAPSLIFKDRPLIFFPVLFFLMLQLRTGLLARDKNIFWLIFFLILAALLNYRIQAKFFPYHLIIFWGGMMIYAGFGFAWMMDWLSRRAGRLLGKAVPAIFSAGLIFFMLANLDPWMKKFALNYCFRDLNRAYLAGFNTDNDRHFSADYYRAAQYLKPLVRPEDQIIVFFGYPLIPFLLKKKMPTWFPCSHQLLFLRYDGELLPRQAEWRNRYTREIIQARPRFFIVTDRWPGQYYQLFHFADREFWPAFRTRFPELHAFFIGNYKLKTKIGRVWIYEWRPRDQGKDKKP